MMSFPVGSETATMRRDLSDWRGQCCRIAVPTLVLGARAVTMFKVDCSPHDIGKIGFYRLFDCTRWFSFCQMEIDCFQ